VEINAKLFLAILCLSWPKYLATLVLSSLIAEILADKRGIEINTPAEKMNDGDGSARSVNLL